jgi:hypothetical protein
VGAAAAATKDTADAAAAAEDAAADARSAGGPYRLRLSVELSARGASVTRDHSCTGNARNHQGGASAQGADQQQSAKGSNGKRYFHDGFSCSPNN